MTTAVPIRFDIYQGDQLVRSEVLQESIIKVGKLPSSHLRIEDDAVSRMHAVIEVSGPHEVHIIDLGSASGTVVNGQKVNKAQLSSGDELMLGDVRVVLTIGDATAVAGEATPVQAAPRAPAPSPFAAPAAPSTQLGMGAAQPPGAGSVPPVAPGSLPPMAPGSVPPPAYSSAPPPPASPPVMGRPPVAPTPATSPPGFAAQTAAPQPSLPNPFAQPAVPEPTPVAAEPEDPEQVRYGIVATGPAIDPQEVETGDPAVEVMIMWGDNAVLSVEHLNPIRSYYVGEAQDDKGNYTTDYLIGSELLGTERLPVVVAAGAGAAVVIPQGASGEVAVGDQVMSVSDLVASGRAQASSEMPGAYQYPLPAGATARIVYRGLTFVVRPTNAGKIIGLGGAPKINWKENMWTLISLAVHALFLLMMYFMPPSSSSLSLDLLNADSRLAKYLIEPPETLEEETPDWLSESEADDEGGKGKRHKDDEGQMGEEKSEKTKNKYAIEGPADNEDPHMAREQAKEEAATAGILGVLAQNSGAWNSPTSPYGEDSALGYDPTSAMGALMGDNIGSNFGFGGLGLRGTGRGGGGTGEGTIGLGNIGTIGHGGGGGSGSGYGKGAGGFRGRKASVPKIRSGNADVRGSLSKEVIRRVIRRHINEVRFCYEQELNSRPDLEGRVSIKFIISPSGAVQAANVAGSTIGSSRVDNCVAQAVRRWTFPAPDGGGIVVVTYPFLLQSAG